MHNSDRLPPRDLPRRRSGRHRNPLSFDSWVGTPTLVLAVPAETGSSDDGSDGAGIGAEMADLVRAYRPEVTLRHGRAGSPDLVEALAGLESREDHPLRGVVVPLVTGPHRPTSEAVDAAVAEAGADVRVTEALGPHPMLAETLHLRLAEAGFVRADRMRLISVVAPGTQMTDGVVVGAVGGDEGISAAGVTAVLLAARLGITVLPADLEDRGSLDDAFQQLSAAGCARPVIAPCAVGPEFPAERLDELARHYDARASAPLGAGSTLAKIAALRYAEVLNTLGAEVPPTADDVPAPVGSRHRQEE
ncbi:hypothetical protein HNR25_004351 [Streptomonospora salina]|uniref:Cobalamin biosynthesis protein CbiX n=1 Tax=Streptomonospora salina TaxID=104205 RepID=A0A841EJS1_9ACTN|nr:cobalamin biosynthesis protein CbiX [Streptomonospora salina]MBB6000600.1 hypothetical protein [Streptomonospora salina]